MTEEKAEIIRKHFTRMREINSHSTALTASLAKFNIMAIMKLGNSSAPVHLKLPEEEIQEVKELITNGPKSIIGPS